MAVLSRLKRSLLYKNLLLTYYIYTLLSWTLHPLSSEVVYLVGDFEVHCRYGYTSALSVVIGVDEQQNAIVEHHSIRYIANQEWHITFVCIGVDSP